MVLLIQLLAISGTHHLSTLTIVMKLHLGLQNPLKIQIVYSRLCHANIRLLILHLKDYILVLNAKYDSSATQKLLDEEL